MNNEDLENMARNLIEAEMKLFEKKKKLERLLTNRSSDESIFNTLDEINALQKRTDAMMEANRIMRNEINQANLVNSFEIVGLQDDAVENTDELAEVLSQALHIPIAVDSIRGFETIDAFTLQRQPPISRPAKITVVHMARREERDHILELAGSAPLHLEGADEPLRINEHLTLMNRHILRKTIEEAVRLGLGPVWVEDGKIFVRKTETSEPIQICSDADIRDLVDI